MRAAQLELDRLADKRYATDKARRLAAIALIGRSWKEGNGWDDSASALSSDTRQKQQDMF